MTRIKLSKKNSYQGVVHVPGDKSIAHRAALFAGLAKGKSILHDYPSGEDNQTSLQFIASIGAKLEKGVSSTTVIGFAKTPQEPLHVLDCANSGTTTRLGLGLLAGFPITVTLVGDASLTRRPMARVVKPLRQMGAQFLGRHHDQYLPLTIRGGVLDHFTGDTMVASAQVKSAIILAALTSGKSARIQEPARSRDHTERMLQHLGYKLEQTPGNIVFAEQKHWHDGFEWAIPGDPSSAAFWAALAVACPESKITIENICLNPTRTGFFRCLEQMGAQIVMQTLSQSPEHVGHLVVQGKIKNNFQPSAADVLDAIDELPLLALLGLFVDGGVTIHHAQELRVKETDRIESTAAVARAFGGNVVTYEDGLHVEPPRKWATSVTIDSQGDHRIALAAAVIALAKDVDIVIERAEAAAVSYPNFWQQLETLAIANITYLDADV